MVHRIGVLTNHPNGQTPCPFRDMPNLTHYEAVGAPNGWGMLWANDILKKGDVVCYGNKLTGFQLQPEKITGSTPSDPHGFIVMDMEGSPVIKISEHWHPMPDTIYCVLRKAKFVKPPYTPSK